MLRTASAFAFAFAFAAAALLPAGIAAAQFDMPGQQPRTQSASDVSSVLVLTDKSVISADETFHILVVFDTEPRWHIYWKNPGEGAAAPNIRINAPEGFKVGDIRWPRPKVVASPIGDLYCYEGRTALFVPITAPAEVDGRDAAFAIDLGYAVCDSAKCFFGRASLNATVKTSAQTGGSSDEAADASLIERHRKRLPALIADAKDASAELTGEGDTRVLTVKGPAHGHASAIFFAYDSQGVRYGKPQLTFEGDRFTAVVELTINRTNFTRGAPKIGGLVALGTKVDDPSYEVEFPLEPQSEAAAN